MGAEGARDREEPAAPQAARGGHRGTAEGEGAVQLTGSSRLQHHQSHSAAFAVNGFSGSPVEQLARVLAADGEAQSRMLRARGIEDEEFVAELRRSCTLCQRAALLYPQGSELAVSFNGGKDACVVLYLWLASLAAAAGRCQGEQGAADQTADGSSGDALSPPTAAPSSAGSVCPGQAVIFFDSPDEFPEVRSFVAWVVRSLGLREVKVESSSFKRGMGDLVDGGLKAVVMGQRRGDPWTEKVDAFSPSDPGWPAFMRVNPILEWSYCNVWTFLRAFDLPYCILYDEGYTSVGTVENTVKNPALLRPDGFYAPAYELADGRLERSGRAASAQASTGSGISAKQAGNAQQPDEAAATSSATLPTLLSMTPPRTPGMFVIGRKPLALRIS